ncbi:azurin [Rhodanobacter caeni]|jgi:azurin
MMIKIKLGVLAAACVFALSACSDKSPTTTPEAAPASPATAPTAATPQDSMQAMPPAQAPTTPAAAAADTNVAANGKPTAQVTNCSTEFEGTDAMQYSISSIVVPASCTDFKITLKHTGKLPVAAMGHDVVITKTSDVEAVDADGRAAGQDNGYVKPDDPRVIAHTKLIGGGETTSVSFPVSKIKDGGPYTFFCSFPGHSALMKGSISVQ